MTENYRLVAAKELLKIAEESLKVVWSNPRSQATLFG